MKRYMLGLTGFLVVLCAFVYVRAADEIKLDLNVRVEKDALLWEQKPGRVEVDMAGDSISDIVQTFAAGTTTAVTIASGVATEGWVWMRNVTTNATWYIEVGPTNVTTFLPTIRLEAEEIAVFRMDPACVLFAAPHGGNVNLRTAVIED